MPSKSDRTPREVSAADCQGVDHVIIYSGSNRLIRSADLEQAGGLERIEFRLAD